MSTTTTPDAIAGRDAILPEILTRLGFIDREVSKTARLLARAGAQRERRQAERILTACKEIHELVRALDELPRQLADAEKARQDVQDRKIQADKLAAEAKDKAAAEAEAVNDG